MEFFLLTINFFSIVKELFVFKTQIGVVFCILSKRQDMYLYYLSRYVLVSKPFMGLEQFNILIENFRAEIGGFLRTQR